MKIIYKLALASAIAYNSCFAADFFIGGTVGTSANSLRVEDNNVKVNRLDLSSIIANLEGGAVFQVHDSVSLSGEVFASYNTLSGSRSLDIVKQNFITGLKTRLIVEVMDTMDMYVTLGIGMSRFSPENTLRKQIPNIGGAKYGWFVRAGFGGEYMASKNVGVFAGMDFDIALRDPSWKLNGKDVKVNLLRYGTYIGARFYF